MTIHQEIEEEIEKQLISRNGEVIESLLKNKPPSIDASTYHWDSWMEFDVWATDGGKFV